VFVGNLNYETTQQDLETLFAEVGAISEVFLPTDRATGRPRGFAFVEFTDAATVLLAIEKLDGAELQGRTIRVSEARARAARSPDAPFEPSPSWGGDDRPGRGGAGKPKGSRRGLRARKRGF